MASHSQVSHNFAHRTGEKKNGSGMFYELESNGLSTIYSYGKHFAIATLFPHWEQKALMTQQTYSVSTAKHISHVHNAISHFNVLEVPENTDNYIYWESGEYKIGINKERAQSDFKVWNDELLELIQKQERARTRDYQDEIIFLVNNAMKYADWFSVKPYSFGLLRQCIYNDTTDEQILNRCLGSDVTEQIKEREQAERKRKAKKLKADIERFRNFNTDHLYGTDKTYLRTDGVSIETSKGIIITDLELAKYIYQQAKISKRMATDKPLTIHIKIAGWNIDQITSNGTIKAGCHTITFDEQEKIADKLNW